MCRTGNAGGNGEEVKFARRTSPVIWTCSLGWTLRSVVSRPFHRVRGNDISEGGGYKVSYLTAHETKSL